MSIFFEPITFFISIAISILGFVGVLKRNKAVLIVGGSVGLFQALAALFALTFFSATGAIRFQITYLLFICLSLVILTVGSIKALQLRDWILKYEQVHGPLPRCCRRCDSEQPQPQSLVVQNSIDSVAIPMQNFESNQFQPQQQFQPPQYQFIPQPIVSAQNGVQQIPAFYPNNMFPQNPVQYPFILTQTPQQILVQQPNFVYRN